MPRIQFSDVTPPDNRRSIRDVPIPTGGKRKVPINIKPVVKPVIDVAPIQTNTPPAPAPQSNFNAKMSEISEKKTTNAYEYYYPKKGGESEYAGTTNKSKKKTWIFSSVIVVVIVVFIIGMMTIFASATINIVPKNQKLSVAIETNATNEMEEGSIKYEVVKLSQSKTVSVPATGEEVAEIKASGKILIYNNFSSEPQRLIIRTRFETKEGLIYRIPESVVVPGKTTKNGVTTPGSIEVQVYADEPGEKYNIGKVDFTVPGFKSDSVRFNNFYARSVSDMTGGFVGKMKTLLPADKQTALQNIDSEIQADLIKEMQTKIPDGLVLLTDSIIFKSIELPAKDESSSVLLGKEVTAFAILFNKEELSQKISTEYLSELPEWQSIKPSIYDFSPLSVDKITGNPENGEKISLQLKGEIDIWANIDTTAISQKLVGAPKGDVQKVMDEYAGISSITAAIRPVWKQTFPQNTSKIRVETKLDK